MPRNCSAYSLHPFPGVLPSTMRLSYSVWEKDEETQLFRFSRTKEVGDLLSSLGPNPSPTPSQPRLWLFLGTSNRLLYATRNPQRQGLCAPQLHLSMPLLPFLFRAESLSHLTRIQSVQMSCLLQTCSKINPRKLPDVLFVLWCFSVLVSRD